MTVPQSGQGSTDPKIAFLADPAHYPERPSSVEVIETHFAWVFLTDRHVYKLKKALRRAEMDYRTLKRREWGCREELRLNRRLAPSVYESVVPLVRRSDGRLALGGDGRIVDWLVRMKRLPHRYMLDELLRRGGVSDAQLRRLMRVLSRFFAEAESVPFTPDEYVQRMQERVHTDGRDLRRRALRLAPARVRRTFEAQGEFLRRHYGALQERARWIVEGHGDLRPEHVWLGRPLAVIDALEFDRNLRILDPAEEVAFLALECERLGGPEIAQRILTHFRAASEACAPDAVMHFYMSRRAATRAKLAAWHVLDPRQFPDPRPWIARAHSYLDDAWRHATIASRLAAQPGAGSGGAGQRSSSGPTGIAATMRLRASPMRRVAGRTKSRSPARGRTPRRGSPTLSVTTTVATASEPSRACSPSGVGA